MKFNKIETNFGPLYHLEEDQGSIVQILRETGEYQPWIMEQARKYVRPGSTVLDVGANIGVFSIQFAKLCDGNVNVVGYEPVFDLYVTCMRNKTVAQKTALKNVKFVNMALSNKEEVRVLDYNPTDSGLSNINDSLPKSLKSYKSMSYKLDDLNIYGLGDDFKFNISFIKVDIQGHELEFIEGAEETLKNNDCAVVMEICRVDTESYSKDPNADLIINKMRSLGFRKHKRLKNLKVKDGKNKLVSTKDVLFIK